MNLEAAKLTFNDGTVLFGTIVEITPDKIILEYDFGRVERFRNKISSITLLSPEEEIILNQDYSESGLSKESSSSMVLPDPILQTQSTNSENRSQPAADTGKNIHSMESLHLIQEKMNAEFEKNIKQKESSFLQEKKFWEQKINELNLKINQISDEKTKLLIENSSKDKAIEELKNHIQKYEDKITSLKNEVNELNQTLLGKDVDYADRIKSVLNENRSLWEKEKLSLVESYESRLRDLERELSGAHVKLIDMSKTNKDLQIELVTLQNLNDKIGLKLATVESEFEGYKQETQKNFNRHHTQNIFEKQHVEKMLESTINQLNQEKQKNLSLIEQETFLKNQLAEIQTELILQREKFQELSNENKHLLIQVNEAKSSAESAMLRNEKEKKEWMMHMVSRNMHDSFTSEQSESEANSDISGTSSAMFRMYQQDMGRLASQIEAQSHQIAALEMANAELKKKGTMLNTHNTLTEQVSQIKSEQQKLKDEMHSMAKDLQQGGEMFMPEESTEPEIENVRAGFSLPTDKDTQINHEEMNDRRSSELFDESFVTSSTDHVELTENSDKFENEGIKIGVISQIEEHMKRVYFDLSEQVNENDMAYIKTESGWVGIKIFRVIEAFNGAVADVLQFEHVGKIKPNDTVWMR